VIAPAASAIDAAAVLARLGTPVRQITSDSRAIAPGDAFAAYPGEARDGRSFIPDALRRGAGSVLWEQARYEWPAAWHTPNAAIANLRQELGFIADQVYDHPSQQLWTVGVTGTNGKTSCTHWIAQALTAVGRAAAVAGTLGNGLYGTVKPALNTTPDAAALHEMLRRWKNAGAQSVAMEVSSHGLIQGRVNGVKFDVALFTNLTRDHLDYHRTMDAYGAAKARLFDWPSLKTAVINAEDPFGQQLIEGCRSRGVAVLTYGQTTGDITTRNLGLGVNGVAAEVVTPWGNAEFTSGVVGSFNVSNLLGVLGVLLASDVPLEKAIVQLARFEPVAGRMQKVGGGGQPLVVVDYAHTPDALEQVLGALRPVAASRNGRLVVVFGCGGDRDPGKRPQMGAIASRLADKVVLTSDNPRGEEPEAIIAQIVAGTVGSKARIECVAARDAALAGTIAEATENDTVLIAGKGHETYQEIAGVRHPFSDLDHARTALAAWSRP
jgi:UDP-N-acetylmuramoyl-L-alanyl-D-glutamate--2,6-diaminopimelate ligase